MKQTNLNKEQEWGLAGIKIPLMEAGRKADEIFGPVMENRGKEEKYRAALGLVEKHRDLLEIPNLIIDAIKRVNLMRGCVNGESWLTSVL